MIIKEKVETELTTINQKRTRSLNDDNDYDDDNNKNRFKRV